MKYVVQTFNPEQSVIKEANNYRDIINEFKENNKDFLKSALFINKITSFNVMYIALMVYLSICLKLLCND